MSDSENAGRQYRQQFRQESAEEHRQKETGTLCKKCGAELEDGSLFCPQCGEKAGGEEYVCQFCKEKTTKEWCPLCGKRVIPVTCPKCGSLSVFDACENCGTLLNPKLEAFVAQEKAEPVEMSAEEAQKIEEEFKQQPVSQEFEKFQKKLIERQILLEERDYFNKREKRIIKVFGSQPFSLELPDPEEESFRMKAYAGLEKIVIERQEKLLREEWERQFPEEKKVPVNKNGIVILKKQVEIDAENRRAELERKREEMEKRYRELLSKVDGEVEAHRIAEEKRKEEERLRREEEERRKKEEAACLERERQKERERQRLEREAYENRILGYYYYSSEILCIESKSNAYTRGTAPDGTNFYCTYNASYSEPGVSFRIRTVSQSKRSNWSHKHIFQGTLNTSGTMISGNWDDGGYMTYYKR